MKSMIAAQRPPSSTQLLARILEAPDLAAQVQALPAPALAKLIDRVGLEDAGEIVALATTEQIAGVWDEDLWRSDRVGEDPRFDGDRFVVWLAVMREAGDRYVAEKLAELSEELVTLAFHGEILVLGTHQLAAELDGGGDDADAIEKALAGSLSEELDEYILVSRHHEGWDDVLAALLALDERDHDLVLRILERCRQMTEAHVDDEGGLYEVLSAIETLETDVAGDREDRRAEMGFVAPSAATAFLALARGEVRGEPPPDEHDPLTKAYFRDVSSKAHEPARARTTRRTDLVALLAEGDDANDAPIALLPAAAGARGALPVETLLVRAMRELAREATDVFVARSDELAYLANVLRAGWSVGGRRLRPVEAIAAALAATDRGLALACARERTRERDEVARAVRVLSTHPADGLFRLAWKRLHEEPGALDALFAKVTSTSDAERGRSKPRASRSRSSGSAERSSRRRTRS